MNCFYKKAGKPCKREHTIKDKRSRHWSQTLKTNIKLSQTIENKITVQ